MIKEYTTTSKKAKNPSKEADKIEISEEAFLIASLINMLIERK